METAANVRPHGCDGSVNDPGTLPDGAADTRCSGKRNLAFTQRAYRRIHMSGSPCVRWTPPGTQREKIPRIAVCRLCGDRVVLTVAAERRAGPTPCAWTAHPSNAGQRPDHP